MVLLGGAFDVQKSINIEHKISGTRAHTRTRVVSEDMRTRVVAGKKRDSERVG